MGKTDLDRKYFQQYMNSLNEVGSILGKEINTDLDNNGTFIDKRVSFGYAIFVLERIRVEKITRELEDVAYKGLDEMYQLGKESMLSGGYYD